jgi:spore coat polysaccharide biosynthesis protein SpsF
MGIKMALAIQARMSSLRFPGKILTPLCGVPMLKWTINSCRVIDLPIYVLTSLDKTDDDLVEYLEANNIGYFRGSLSNVLERYLSFMCELKIDRVIRISGDSPLINPEVIMKVMEKDKTSKTGDITTNVYPRTFPKGQSVEIIPRRSLESLSNHVLSQTHNEHVTTYFYDNANLFRINNLVNYPDLSSLNLSVDTKKDFQNIEHFIKMYSLQRSAWPLGWEDFSNTLLQSRLF